MTKNNVVLQIPVEHTSWYEAVVTYHYIKKHKTGEYYCVLELYNKFEKIGHVSINKFSTSGVDTNCEFKMMEIAGEPFYYRKCCVVRDNQRLFVFDAYGVDKKYFEGDE